MHRKKLMGKGTLGKNWTCAVERSKLLQWVSLEIIHYERVHAVTLAHSVKTHDCAEEKLKEKPALRENTDLRDSTGVLCNSYCLAFLFH